MNTYITNRTSVAAGQFTKSTLITNTYASAWGSANAGIITSGVLTFTSATAMQYYFNQGGNVNIQGIKSGLTALPQDVQWNAMLDATGYVFNATSLASLVPGQVSPLLTLNNTSANTATRVFTLENQTGGTGSPTYSQNYVRIDANVRYDQAKIYYQVVYYDGSVPLGITQTVSPTVGHYVYASAASGAFSGTNPTATTTSAWAATTTFAP
jgi:hypothetical protein